MTAPRTYGEEASSSGTVHLEGVRKRALEIGRARLLVTAGMFALAFLVIAGRLVDVSVLKSSARFHARAPKTTEQSLFDRADITDRNGVLLATSLPTVSLYAHPHEVANPKGAAVAVTKVLPELSTAEIQSKLQSERAFVYLRRNLTPRQEYEINALGIPGLYFEKSEKRIYPQGDLTAQVVGLTDLDDKGVAGVEKAFETELKSRHQPLRLSLDVRVQTILKTELAKTRAEFHAIGATGIVMNVKTGEVLGLVSLPDYDPNNMTSTSPDAMFNRATLGVYEMGSTFKLFNTAAALDAGTSTMTSTYDVTHKIKVARFEIYDYHPEHHPLTVAEILKVSSNIGSARMAMDMGIENQKAFMSRMGMLRPASIELPEVGSPLFPANWREVNTMTISYGHGMAVTPLHVATGVSALVNGGEFHPPTLIFRDATAPIPTQKVIKPETSRTMRQLMRLVVTDGTGSKADVPGYEVGGKTGTAEKNVGGVYHHKSLLSSFVAAFPISDPKYVVLAMIDEPQGTKESYGFATAGWTAAPVAARVITQIAPLLGLPPVEPKDPPEEKKPHTDKAAANRTSAGVKLAKAE